MLPDWSEKPFQCSCFFSFMQIKLYQFLFSRLKNAIRTLAIGLYTDFGMCGFRPVKYVLQDLFFIKVKQFFFFFRPDKGIDCNASWHFNSSLIEVNTVIIKCVLMYLRGS